MWTFSLKILISFLISINVYLVYLCIVSIVVRNIKDIWFLYSVFIFSLEQHFLIIKQQHDMDITVTINRVLNINAITSNKWYWYHSNCKEYGFRKPVLPFLMRYSTHQTALSWGDSFWSTNLSWAILKFWTTFSS